MALVQSLTLPATTALKDGVVVDVPEITYPAAYARVYSVQAFVAESFLLVCWYADEAARLANDPHVKIKEYRVPTSVLAGDIYPMAYAWLKQQDDFAGATDHPFVDPAEVVEPAPTEPTEPTPAPVEPAPEPIPTQPEAQA